MIIQQAKLMLFFFVVFFCFVHLFLFVFFFFSFFFFLHMYVTMFFIHGILYFIVFHTFLLSSTCVCICVGVSLFA